jgi:hypothetical protein
VVKKEETNAVHSLVEHLTGGDRTWTIKELALWGGIGGVGPVSSAPPPQLPTFCKIGSRRLTSMDSISLMR